jgi:hypothetical protein
MKIKAVVIFLALFILLIPYFAEAGVSIVGELTREKSSKIGEAYSGIIFVRNTSETPQGVKIYQTDYLFFQDGNNIYGEPGKDPRSNAKWITFTPNFLTIPPKEKAEIQYTIKIPEDKTLMGTYWSMFMVEGVANSPLESEVVPPTKDEIKASVKTLLRYGIQMITNIGDTGVRKLKFMEIKVMTEKDKVDLQIGIENIGERGSRPSLYTELYDDKGNYIGKFSGGQLRIYPGTSAKFSVDMSQVPKGKYKAMIIVDCGGDDLFGMPYDLVLE